jgi:hypothetical protein
MQVKSSVHFELCVFFMLFYLNSNLGGRGLVQGVPEIVSKYIGSIVHLLLAARTPNPK